MEKITYVTYRPSSEADAKVTGRDVLFIDNEVASRLLSIGDCLDAVESAYRAFGLGGATASRATHHVLRPAAEGWHRLSPMVSGIAEEGVVAIRIKSDVDIRAEGRMEWYCVAPGKYCGLILLFSSEDGAPLAILNDGHIQHMRVGAAGGLSVKYLARRDASVLGLLGTAGMASTHAWSIAKVRPIKKIKVFSPDREHRRRFARQMSEDMGIEVVVADEPRAVVEGSDIVAACTNSRQPVVHGAWLEPGMHVLSVGPGELDDDVFRRAHRYVYSRTPATEHYVAAPPGPRPAQVMGDDDTNWIQRERRLMAEEKMSFLADVILGRAPGRISDEEVTCFTSQGIPIQFTATAHRVYQLARQRGLGRRLPLAWFLQDIHN